MFVAEKQKIQFRNEKDTMCMQIIWSIIGKFCIIIGVNTVQAT